MIDLCALVNRPFKMDDWAPHFPEEPYFNCSDNGQYAQYDWLQYGLLVRTSFDDAGQHTDSVELHVTDLAGAKPWTGALPGGLTPRMDRGAVQAHMGPPVEVFENPDEQTSPFPFPYLGYDLANGVRLTVCFRLGQMYGVTLS